jgi:hypothetical protein
MTDYRTRAWNSAKMAIVHGVEDDAYLPDPPCAPYEDLLHALYHACLDAFTPPEPADVTRDSEVSAMMLTTLGQPVNGRAIGVSVQRRRDDLRTAGRLALYGALRMIEQERRND